ncbi:hypothetical protein A2U01_0069997, partial [Trifolium medium]|nr:hypothetical protein [Trifolium medium]
MTFSPNIHHSIQQEFQAAMPIRVTENINKYLGMPTQIGRSKHQVFKFIMDRVWNKLKKWKEKKLSFAGK